MDVATSVEGIPMGRSRASLSARHPLARRLAVRLTGNRRGQRVLAWTAFVSQALMGIGTGASVGDSGERAVLEALRASSPGPYRVFDVGANRGDYLRLVLDVLGDRDVSVHCFEPGESTFRLLGEGLEKDPVGGVVLNRLALGAEPGERTLYYDEPGSEMASLTLRRLDHFGMRFDRSETVQVDTVDHYCETHGVSRIDLLKCDVEGHELDVFHGAAEMFAAGLIGMATFEFGGGNIDTRTYFQDFFYFFEGVGMSLSRVTPSGYPAPIDSYREIDEQFRVTNFVAVRRPGEVRDSPGGLGKTTT
jgi:FkbM family methyltransferase